MKIGLLTLPLHHNYGGTLQAYALMTVLKNMGHEVWLIDRQPKQMAMWKFSLAITKRIVLKFIFCKKINICEEKIQIIQCQNFRKFIDKYIQPQTKTFHSYKDLLEINNDNFDAYIVGSDQVWREEYYRTWKKNFFFDFVTNENSKLIAYAASIGVGKWEYDERMTKELGQLAKRFTAISVREDSAIRMCQEFLGVCVEQCIDPTMLLKKSDYIDLIGEEEKSEYFGDLLMYILEESSEKKAIIDTISNYVNLSPFSVNIRNVNSDISIEDDIYPSITYWLKGFAAAKYVVTDSFHGCVFSILYNKPFIAIGNIKGGLTRFTSLLEMFELENRLVMNGSDVTEEKISAKINWEAVNAKLLKQREKALEFLINSITL